MPVMRDLVHLLAKLALVALLALGLGTSSFAHHGLGSHDLQLEAYVLSGGDLAALCGDEGQPGASPKADCPACQLAATALPPAVTGFAHAADLVFVAQVVAPRANRAARTVLDIANGLRAPPQV